MTECSFLGEVLLYTQCPISSRASPGGMLRHCEDKQIVHWYKNAGRNALCQHIIFQEAEITSVCSVLPNHGQKKILGSF